MTPRQLLRDFFRTQAPMKRGQGLVVAFSGGADSCVLLAGMRDLAAEQGLRLYGAHLNHCLDPGSEERARRAFEIATDLGVPLMVGTRPVLERLRRGESLEEGARRVRYAFLEEIRDRLDARYVATAHHRDDQSETVLLRLAFGSGLDGLSGILPVHGTVLRPLLRATRSQLIEELCSLNLSAVEDPTNADVRFQRNRIRRLLLPRLSAQEPDLSRRLAVLAGAAAKARTSLDRRLAKILDLRREPQGEVSLSLSRVSRLPQEVLSPALSLLQRHSEAAYPIPRAARQELLRQIRAGGRLRLDCGAGWRLEGHQDRLLLHRAEPPMPFFSYTFRVPGTLEIPEIGARLQLRPEQEGVFDRSSGGVEPVFAVLACLQLPLGPGDRVTVRNRRPGDRVYLPRAKSGRRLKQILIDLKVPRWHRDRLPLLCIGDDIVWIPGVATGKLLDDKRPLAPWNAEITDS